MNLGDRLLYFLYQRMESIKKKKKIQLWRSRCVCSSSTKFYETAAIKNIRDRNVIKIGSNTHIKGEINVFGKNGRVRIGKECFVGINSYIWSAESIYIGDRVLISHNCNIFDNDVHPKNSKQRNKQFLAIVSVGQPAIDLKEKPVVIEDDVLICANVTILKGVRIGKKSIIGTGTVVTHDIPEKSIAFGNPMVIKHNDAEDDL